MTDFARLKDGLRVARETRGDSQRHAATKAQIPQPDLSRYESGLALMGDKAAKKLAKAYGGSAEPETLRFLNLRAVVGKAIQESDHETVMSACKSAAELTEGQELTEHGEEVVSTLMDEALEFMQGLGGTNSSSESYGMDFSEGRDANGHRVGVTKARDRAENSLWGSVAPVGVGSTGQEKTYEPADYEAACTDGRDPVTGHRIAPFDIDEDEDMEEYDDER